MKSETIGTKSGRTVGRQVPRNGRRLRALALALLLTALESEQHRWTDENLRREFDLSGLGGALTAAQASLGNSVCISAKVTTVRSFIKQSFAARRLNAEVC